MNSQRVQHDEVGSAWYSTEQNNLGIGNGMQPGDPALCQLQRHTFVPYRRRRGSSKESR